MEELKNKIKKEFEKKEFEEKMEIVDYINSYNGALDYLRYEYNDEEFFNVFFEDKIEIARAICYGNYNYAHEYVKFNAYGNLVSATEWDIEREYNNFIDEIVDEIANTWNDDEYMKDTYFKGVK